MLTISAQCWLCRMPLALISHGMCSRCTSALLSERPCCPRCALPALSGRQACGRCLQKMPPWSSLLAAGAYLPPLSTFVQQFKFNHTPALAKPLARLMLLRALAARRAGLIRYPDVLVSVPLHRGRQWRRGFNQSALLAESLAHWLPCTHHPGQLIRTQPARIQHRLNARQRARNLKNAFRLEFPVEGCHIAIVDDIVTTGSTVSEIARVLKQGGAASLQVWCLCRTL